MKELQARYDELDETDQHICSTILEQTLMALESGAGCAVLVADTQGDGSATLIAGGNELLVEPLLRAAGSVSEHIAAGEKRSLQ